MLIINTLWFCLTFRDLSVSQIARPYLHTATANVCIYLYSKDHFRNQMRAPTLIEVIYMLLAQTSCIAYSIEREIGILDGQSKSRTLWWPSCHKELRLILNVFPSIQLATWYESPVAVRTYKYIKGRLSALFCINQRGEK